MNSSGLIVDFGGVLTTSIFESFKIFCVEHGITPEKLKAALVAEMTDPDHPTHLIETGRITADEFNRHLAERLSDGLEEPLSPEGLKDRLFAHTRPEPRMVNAVTSLKSAGVSTALLSNSWGGDGYPRESFTTMFDAVVLSGEVGLRKPDSEIYRMTSKLLGKEPEECVFVDDLKVNVEGAEKVGMKGVLHSDPSETVALLEEIFEVDLTTKMGG